MATILAMWLSVQGFNVTEVITFGAPKVTDHEGAVSQEAFAQKVHLPGPKLTQGS